MKKLLDDFVKKDCDCFKCKCYKCGARKVKDEDALNGEKRAVYEERWATIISLKVYKISSKWICWGCGSIYLEEMETQDKNYYPQPMEIKS